MKKQYITYTKKELTADILNAIKVGDKIKVNNWVKPLTVIAVSDNFFIMQAPHFSTYQYSICEKFKRGYAYNLPYRTKTGPYKYSGFDKDEFVCGPDDHYCRFNYSKKDQAEEALKLLEVTRSHPNGPSELEVSQRHGWGIQTIAIKKGK